MVRGEFIISVLVVTDSPITRYIKNFPLKSRFNIHLSLNGSGIDIMAFASAITARAIKIKRRSLVISLETSLVFRVDAGVDMSRRSR